MNVNERQLRILIQEGEGIATEFSGATSRLIIEYGRVVTDNPSRPHGFGLLDPDTMVPYQKNPILSAFFREIDRADELGSGMRKMMLYGKKYGGADPQLIEGDNFRMIISVPEFRETEEKEIAQVTGQVSEQVTAQVGAKLALSRHQVEAGMISRLESRLESKLAAKVVVILSGEEAGKAGLADHLGHKTVSGELHKQIRRLVDADYIEMTIPDKPNSRNQKYRLTDKGRALLKEMKP